MEQELVDRAGLRKLKLETGAGFGRIFGYFRDDGMRSIRQIDDAMQARNAAAMVLPSHSLKGEALQFGATALAAAAEQVEMSARRCVELHVGPETLVADIRALRPLFDRTIALLATMVAPHGPAPAPTAAPAPAPQPVAPAMPATRSGFGRRTTFGTASR